MINKFKHFDKSSPKLSTVGSFAFISDAGGGGPKMKEGKNGISLWKSTSAGNGCRLKGHRCTGKLLLEGVHVNPKVQKSITGASQACVTERL